MALNTRSPTGSWPRRHLPRNVRAAGRARAVLDTPAGRACLSDASMPTGRSVPKGRRAMALVLAATWPTPSSKRDHPDPASRLRSAARRCGGRHAEPGFPHAGECELGFTLPGSPAVRATARWLLAEALPAWRDVAIASTSTPARSIIPRPSPAYLRAGFTVQARVERFPDRASPASCPTTRASGAGPGDADPGPRRAAEHRSAPAISR